MIKIQHVFVAIICMCFIFNSVEAQNAGIELKAPSSVLEQVVGDEVTFTIVARDKTGDIIRGWNTSGTDVTLVVSNSGANTDNEPLTETVMKDINGNQLQRQGANTFIVPKILFVDGETRVTFMTTKADTGIFFTASPAVVGIKNVSATMNYRPGEIQNFLVEIVPAAQPNIVYVFRRYELRVTPRDRYNNINTSENIVIKFTARFPGEFTNQQLGSADIFAGELFIQGPTVNYFLISTQSRIDQVITCFKSSDPLNVRGSTGPYTIADHAPGKFSLISPADNSSIGIKMAAQIQDFTWQAAVDPYTNIIVGGQTYSDEVTYTCIVSSLAGAQLMDMPSNNVAKAAKLTLSGSQLDNIITVTTGMSTSKTTTILWRIEATDGLFKTKSNEEWRLTIFKDGIEDVRSASAPSKFALAQNFPNPVSGGSFGNPTTSISFEIPKTEFVTLKIYDLLGNEIATLVNKTLEAGNHSVTYDAQHIPSGIYVYKLKAGAMTATRKMTVMR